jgi:hypothetical protein
MASLREARLHLLETCAGKRPQTDDEMKQLDEQEGKSGNKKVAVLEMTSVFSNDALSLRDEWLITYAQPS